MLELVLWSGLLGLAPWALGLTWKLISGLTGLIGKAALRRSPARRNLRRPVRIPNRPGFSQTLQ